MYSKTAALALLIAYAEARFGQEQIPANGIQALGAFGNPGDAGTLAGQVPSVLLAGANACDQLALADQVIDLLGNDPQVVAAAQALVAAEKNFNPFAVDIPSMCADAGLPANQVLRGIIPIVDPVVLGSDVQNANSASSLQAPLDDAGLSVADISVANGFDNFTAQGSDGSAVFAGDAGAVADVEDVAEEVEAGNDAQEDGVVVECGGAAAPANEDVAADVEEVEEVADVAAGAAGDGLTTSSIAGLDFGLCIPTIDLQGGRNGRPDDELTFLPTDALVAQGQSEALNPGIITNRVCDQLTNVCDANQAAKDACEAIQAELDAEENPRVAETAARFNAALGFENVAFE